jgi:hypothetical protein
MQVIVFTFFCFFVDEKIKLKILADPLQILTVTRFEDPKEAILTLKTLTGSRL